MMIFEQLENCCLNEKSQRFCQTKMAAEPAKIEIYKWVDGVKI